VIRRAARSDLTARMTPVLIFAAARRP